MPRSTPDPAPEIYRCIESFAVHRDGIPVVFAAGSEVLGTDPILKTHRAMFEPAAARLTRARLVEHATAEPGAPRLTTPAVNKAGG